MPHRFNPDIHHRRSIRLRQYDYSQAGAYFVTLCVRNRECLFGVILNNEMRLNECGLAVRDSWDWLARQYTQIDLDAFVVMPNHVHGILVMHDAEKPKSLGRIVGAFKTVSTKNINQKRNAAGLSVWQRNYYEHIIRSDEDLNRIREYIIHNPAQWIDDAEYIP